MPLPRFMKLPEVRRAAILAAALHEFAAHGYEAASLNAILARTGTSKGAAYYYFADKEDLYVTTLEHSLGEIARRTPVLGRIDDQEAFWREATRVYRVIVDLVAERPDIVHLVRRDLARVQSLAQAERLQPALEGARTFIGGIVSAGRRSGALRKDLPERLVLDLVFAVGQTADAFMIESGEILEPAGRERAIARAMDLLRRLLTPAARARSGPSGTRRRAS